MPGVGRRRFSYTPAGRRAAKKYAKKTGQPIKNMNAYGQGMDRRGGARMGMLSKASNPFGMKRKSPMGRRPMKRKSY
jgi:hypothetical protein|tara:strand:- start:1446 stop:1676 length:231 start_codon:yes stop_codon:yes gene_type:complete